MSPYGVARSQWVKHVLEMKVFTKMAGLDYHHQGRVCSKRIMNILEEINTVMIDPCCIDGDLLITFLTHLPLDKMAAILADDRFKCIFLNENDRILNQISLKCVPRSPIDNKPALVQVMAWHPTGNKPFSEPMRTQFTDIYVVQRVDEFMDKVHQWYGILLWWRQGWVLVDWLLQFWAQIWNKRLETCLTLSVSIACCLLLDYLLSRYLQCFPSVLTHCGLVTPLNNRDLHQYWFR